jgi:hypothetical protein
VPVRPVALQAVAQAQFSCDAGGCGWDKATVSLTPTKGVRFVGEGAHAALASWSANVTFFLDKTPVAEKSGDVADNGSLIAVQHVAT